ncbi:DUF2306 domain-containing protein [Kribbella sp. NPDC051770]|uniref:DUF2306 domain-containing protein n=1 Tax=Kribbella sp. NPDC051770 TaxID=3155413 RepID=UPI0034219170
MTQTEVTLKPSKLRLVQGLIVLLAGIVLAFAVGRMLRDVPHLADGTLPADEIDRAYVEHPWLAYLHIAPSVVYLIGAPIQLAHRIRSKHYTLHRRLGRVLLSCALLGGAFAIVFGVLHPYGGPGEAGASVVFGLWFLVCLVNAFRAIKRDDVVQHRRWMIRAFAVGIGVGTIRIWIFVFTAAGWLDFPDAFAVAFWLAFAMHVAFAEWWLRTSPQPRG